MRFIAVILGILPNNLAGGGVYHFQIELFRAAQKSGIQSEKSRNAVRIIRHSRMLLGCGYRRIFVFVEIVHVSSEREHVIVKILALRRGCIVVGFELVVFVNRAVVSLALHLVICFVENGSVRPIAVKSEIRNIQVHSVCVGIFKGNVSLNIHTVFEIRVKIRFVRF